MILLFSVWLYELKSAQAESNAAIQYNNKRQRKTNDLTIFESQIDEAEKLNDTE